MGTSSNMTPNKSDSGELRKEMAGIIAEATSEMMSIIGNPDIQPDEVHPMRLSLCKRLLDKSEAALAAHIQAVGEEILGPLVVPTSPRLPGTPESWKRYYEQKAQQELQVEQRKRLAQYLGEKI